MAAKSFAQGKAYSYARENRRHAEQAAHSMHARVICRA